MAIGAPVSLGSATVTADSSVTITTGTTAPATSTIVTLYGVVDTVASDPTGKLINNAVTTDGTNTYTIEDKQVSVNPTSRSSAFFYAFNVAQLLSGSSLVVGPGSQGISSARGALGFYVTGLKTTDPLDVHSNIGTGTGTALASATSGTLVQASEIAIGYAVIFGGSADSFTEDATYTTLGSVVFGTTIIRVAYKIVSSTTAVSYAPTNGTSRNWGANVFTLMGAPDPTGTAAITLGTFTASSAGVVLVQGAEASTLDAVALSATGTVAFPSITATANIQLGPLSGASTGGALIQAAGSITLANLGTLMAASVVVGATANLTFDAMTEAGSAAGSYFSNLNAAFAPMILSAAGTVTVTATGAISLSPIGLTANAPVTVSGALSKTLGGLSVLASGANLSPLTGTFSQTLSPLTLSATGFLWSVDPDIPESWATVSPTSTNWNNTSDSGDVWVPIPDVPESWS